MLTPAQKKTIRQLKTLDSIHCGVNWWGWRLSKKTPGRRYSISLDGRVCNALIKKGALIPVEGSATQYQLAEGV